MFRCSTPFSSVAAVQFDRPPPHVTTCAAFFVALSYAETGWSYHGTCSSCLALRRHSSWTKEKETEALAPAQRRSIIVIAHKGDDFVCHNVHESDLRSASTRSSTRHAAGSSAGTVAAALGEGTVVSKQCPPKGTYVTTNAAERLIRR